MPEISVKLEEGGGLGFFQNFTQSVKFLPFFFGGFPYVSIKLKGRVVLWLLSHFMENNIPF